MNTQDILSRFGVTEEWIEQSAEAYERGDYPHEGSPVYFGSHLDAVGKKRVTVVYDAATTQKVSRLANERGVKPSVIYRDAVDLYLASQT